MFMLARHARHPHAAALLIDWTLSEEGQSLLAGFGYVVARKGVKQSVPALLEKESFLADPDAASGNKLNGETIKPLEHLER
jgi:ABC-type Fe3+ transport system substrate-binding protein